MSEIIPIVNERDSVIGAVEKPKFDKSTGRIYRTAGLFLIDKNGRILIQKRAADKNSWANQWDITGVAGHVDFGETYVEAIIREAEEEIGLKIQNVHFLGKKFGEYPGNRRRFTAIFLAMADFKIEDLAIQESEVAEVRLVSFAELGEMISSGKFDFTQYSLDNLAENQEKIIEVLRKNKIEA